MYRNIETTKKGKNSRVVIFTNGKIYSNFYKYIQSNDFVIGVDRAVYRLLTNKIQVNIAIGDFDSVCAYEMKQIKLKIKKIIEFSSEKDEIDTELAIKYAVSLKPKFIDIYGGFGTRMDHTLASIMLLEPYSSHNIEIRIIDINNIIQLINQQIVIKKDSSLPYFSLISLTDVSTVTISGSKYDICKKSIRRGQSLGVSNEIDSSQAQITVHKGKVLLIRSRD